MDTRARLDLLLELAQRIELEVRHAALGGGGGGLCTLKGRKVLFVDTSADLATQYGRVLSSLARLPEIDAMFVPPELRAELEREQALGPPGQCR